MALFGESFVSGSGLLVVLALGQFTTVISGPCGNLLMMSGYEKLMRNIVGFCGVFNIILNIILIPAFGVIGAAMSTSLGLLAANTLQAYFVYKKLSVNTVPILGRFFQAR